MESNRSKLTGQPTSEVECESIVGYNYVQENEMTEEQRKEQRRVVLEDYGLTDGYGRACNCKSTDGRKCFNETTCINMTDTGSEILRFACPPACSDACTNNPWDKNSFAIDNGKLYLDWDEKKQYGLRAFTTIEKGEYIGEYRGKIIKSGSVFKEENIPKYAFSIPFIGSCVDAYEQGSAMRLINCGCFPNVEAVVYIHDWKFKIVFLCVKKILPNEELLIQYDFTFPKSETLPECFCGHKKCNKEMGRYREFFYENCGFLMPEVVSLNVMGDDLKGFLQTPCTMEVCNPHYKETHKHEMFNTVAAIIPQGKELIVVKARVIGVLKTYYGCYYVIRRPGFSAQDYILPMWATFKYFETAEWRLHNVYTIKDKEMLAKFFEKVIYKRDIQKITEEALPDYVDKLLSDTVPSPTFVNEISMDGDAAVFATTKAFENLTTSSSSRPPVVSDLVISSSPHPPVLPCSKVQDILAVTNELTPAIIYQRIFENVVEVLAILYISRVKPKMAVTYEESRSKLAQVIHPFYFAKDCKEKKFLQYEHYRAAIEIEVQGSNGWMWCSLCKSDHGFATPEMMNDHFWNQHAICAKGYACKKKKCDFTTCYPSKYRAHVVSCTPEVKNALGHDMDEDIIDCLAEYLQLKVSRNVFFNPLLPGLPSFYGFAKQTKIPAPSQDDDTGNVKNKQGKDDGKVVKKLRVKGKLGHKMNLDLKRPEDESIAIVGANWSIATSHSVLTEQSQLKISSKPRHVKRPLFKKGMASNQPTENQRTTSDEMPACSSSLQH